MPTRGRVRYLRPTGLCIPYIGLGVTLKNSINRYMELLIKLLRWFQEFNVSGKKVYRNLSVRVGIVSSRFVRVLCNLRIEFGMKRLRYWGVKSFKIL